MLVAGPRTKEQLVQEASAEEQETRMAAQGRLATVVRLAASVERAAGGKEPNRRDLAAPELGMQWHQPRLEPGLHHLDGRHYTALG